LSIRLDEAFSQELNRNLTPIQANKRYHEGKLKDKRAFHCTSCGVQVTCACMTKVLDSNKKVAYSQKPHFKVYNGHKSG
jgi:hypothetical protein